MAEAAEPEVLVVGAGPTGLTLAAELLVRGVRVRIVDALPVPSLQSRALVVQPRTLELFARLGVAAPLLERGRRALGTSIFVAGRERAQVKLGDVGAGDTPFPFLLFVSQAETEAALRGRVQALGGVIEQDVALTALEEREDCIVGTLTRAGVSEVLRARFVAGCDGAHSTVRGLCGLALKGDTCAQDFLLADVELASSAVAPDRVSFFLGSPGLAVIFPLGEGADGGALVRVIGSFGAAPEGAPAPTLTEVQEKLVRVAQVPLTLRAPRWLARFRLHHRGVDHYRRGRAFLLGDAAHIHSPAGGQGMNTGIQDAMNLGWKLALHLRHEASDKLLDTYEEERLPVGKRLLSFTDRIFSVGSSRNPVAVGLRNALVPLVAPLFAGRRELRASLFRFVSQLGIRYPQSSAVEERAGGEGLHGIAAGYRAPDAPLVTQAGAASSVHAQLAGPAHHLLVFAGPDARDLPQLLTAAQSVLDASTAPVELRLVVPDAEHVAAPPGALIDEAGAARRRFGLRSIGGHVLVRPDGYIAFREESHDFGALSHYLQRWFGKR